MSDIKTLDYEDKVSILSDSKSIDKFLEYIDIHLRNKDSVFASMDFEFDNVGRTHVLSIGQIQFCIPVANEGDPSGLTRSPIFFYDPRIFTAGQKDRFTKFLIGPVTKILHGSESLDLPAIRNYIGDSNFKKFLSTVVDTRFLCEANGIIYGKKEEKVKCSIYSALLDLKLISDAVHSKLSKLKIDYRKRWSLNSLTKDQIVYAATDIAFLYNLYAEYVVRLGPELRDLVTESYRFVILDRHGLFDFDSERNIVVSRLKDLLERNLKRFTFEDLLKIDYFRKSLKTI